MSAEPPAAATLALVLAVDAALLAALLAEVTAGAAAVDAAVVAAVLAVAAVGAVGDVWAKLAAAKVKLAMTASDFTNEFMVVLSKLR